MKRLLITMVLALALLPQAWAQKGRPSREEIQQKKREYLTQELSLSEKEANDLMPILNELDAQRFVLWKDVHQLRHKLRDGADKLSETELKTLFEQSLDLQVKEAELEREYYKKCQKVLGLKKLVHLDRANKQFARHFFQRRK